MIVVVCVVLVIKFGLALLPLVFVLSSELSSDVFADGLCSFTHSECLKLFLISQKATDHPPDDKKKGELSAVTASDVIHHTTVFNKAQLHVTTFIFCRPTVGYFITANYKTFYFSPALGWRQ